MKKGLVILFYPKTEKENTMKNIPIALLKVGSELKYAGYDVAVIDERLEENYQKRLKILLDKALFFGVSTMTGYQIKGGLKASIFVKRTNKNIPVIWGGWHPSILPKETLQNPNIDIVVSGQGEATIRELAWAIKERKELKDIAGISYKKYKEMIFNNRREFQDINSFSPVRFDILDIKKYISKTALGKRSIFWNSSQGCPHTCGFCSTPAVFCRRWSGLKAETLIDQIKLLICDYGIDGVTFAEDNFFVDAKRIETFCKGIIENKMKIKWATDARIDQMSRFSDELMELLKESGCHKLFIGAESGDEDVLKLIDKRIRVKDIYEVAEKLARFKIISEFFIIVGFPLNPQKDLAKSLKLMREIKLKYPNHQFTSFLYTPYPGTPLLDLAIKKGLIVPKKLEEWINWSILTVSTPWVEKKYIDNVNMYSKCFYPLAFPSENLRRKIEKKITGLPYKILHKLAKFRAKRNFFIFPLEWKLIKIFYILKTRFNLFKSLESFR